MTVAGSVLRYAAGNKVYKGATNAPTRGAVDKTGYIERELNKPMGFQNAAQKRLALSTVDPVIAASSKTATPTKSTQAVSAGLPLQTYGKTSTGQNYTTPTSTQQSVNTSGTAGTSTSQPWLATDPTYLQNSADLLALHNNTQSNIANQINQEDLNNTVAQRNYGIQQPIDERNLLNSAGARGLVQSSGYGYNYGQLEDQYTRNLADLANQHAATLASLQSSANTDNQNYQNQLSGYGAAAAQRYDAANAGSAGLDGTNTNVTSTAQYLQNLQNEQNKSDILSKISGLVGHPEDYTRLQAELNHPISYNYLESILPNITKLIAPTVAKVKGK